MKSIEQEPKLKPHQKALAIYFGDAALNRHKLNPYNLLCLLGVIAAFYSIFTNQHTDIIHWTLLTIAICGLVIGLVQVYVSLHAESTSKTFRFINESSIDKAIDFIVYFIGVFYYKSFLEKSIQFWKIIDGFLLSGICFVLDYKIIALMFFISRIARLLSLVTIKISLM